MGFLGGTVIFNADGEEIGKVTSGCPSPCLKRNIAIGYVGTKWSKAGTEVRLDVEGKKKKLIDGTISKMPFVPTHYYTGR